jgi:DNA-binding transcriptional MerR regulator
MAKAKDAFRTISEVAEWLDTPTHVLRFWESKFSQIKPVKGAGGRRYYRPADMELLAGIKQLLHGDGLTIKGTQKLLREKGVKYVATLGQTLAEKPAPTEAPRTTPAAAPAPMPTTVMPTAIQPTPSPAAREEPLQSAFPFDIPARAAPTTTPVLPMPPEDLPEVPARLLADLPADLDKLRVNAAAIAPLVARLASLRARMAG